MSRLRQSISGRLSCLGRAGKAVARNRRSFSIGSGLEGLEGRVVPAGSGFHDSVATAIPVGDVSQSPFKYDANGALTNTAEPDLYTFTVSDTTRVAIDLDDPSSAQGYHFSLGLYTPSNTLANDTVQVDIASPIHPPINSLPPPPGESGDNAPFLDELLPAGTYYLLVQGGPLSQPAEFDVPAHILQNEPVSVFNGYLGSYSIHISLPNTSDDPGSTIADAAPYSKLGARVVGKIETPTDVDMYKLDATAGQALSFSLTTPTPSRAFLALYNSMGNRVDGTSQARGPDDPAVYASGYLEYNVRTAGTYYVGVSAVANSNYDQRSQQDRRVPGTPTFYTLKISDLNTLPDAGSRIGEPKLLLARVATGKKGHFDILERSTDVDMFKIIVRKIPVRVRFSAIPTFISPQGSLQPRPLAIRIFDQAGIESIVSDGTAENPGVVIDHTFKRTGTYYFAVSYAENASYNPLDGTGRRGISNYDANASDAMSGLYRVRVSPIRLF